MSIWYALERALGFEPKVSQTTGKLQTDYSQATVKLHVQALGFEPKVSQAMIQSKELNLSPSSTLCSCKVAVSMFLGKKQTNKQKNKKIQIFLFDCSYFQNILSLLVKLHKF